MAKKMFKVLENNPEVMNHLGAALGMAPTLSFHDIYSLTDPDLLSFIPRPAYALLVIIPLTPTWHAARENEPWHRRFRGAVGRIERERSIRRHVQDDEMRPFRREISATVDGPAVHDQSDGPFQGGSL